MKCGMLRVAPAAGGLKDVVGPFEYVGLLRGVTGGLMAVVGALESGGLLRAVPVTGGLNAEADPLENAGCEDPPGDGENPLGSRFVVCCRDWAL